MLLALNDLHRWGVVCPKGSGAVPQSDPRWRTYPEVDYIILPVLKRDHAILLAMRACLKQYSLEISIYQIYMTFHCPGVNTNKRSLNQAITCTINKILRTDDLLTKRLLSKGTIRWDASIRGTDGLPILQMDEEGAMSLCTVVQIWIIRMREASKTDSQIKSDGIVEGWGPSRSARKQR